MWELRFDASLDAWSAVPAPNEHERRQVWADRVAGIVETMWNAEGNERFSELLGQVLDQLQGPRPDVVIADFVAWPIRSPFPVRVTFILAARTATGDWTSRGFEASPYLQGPFGQGVQYSRRTPSEHAESGPLVDSVIVFERADVGLHVRVHPCPVQVYLLSAEAVAELIESCSLTDSAGQPFTTGTNQYRSLDDTDRWLADGTSTRV